MVQKEYPLSVGLLISMALRYNHSFGILMSPFEQYENLEIKQKEILSEIISYYENRYEPSSDVTTKQIREEIFLQGFYAIFRENDYIKMATNDAITFAKELVEKYAT